MEIIAVSIINIITFMVMVFSVSHYADFTLVMQIVLLIGLLIFLLVRFQRKLISKGVILAFLLCSAIEFLYAFYMGLWHSSLGAFFFFVNEIVFLALLLLINLLKFLLHRIH